MRSRAVSSVEGVDRLVLVVKTDARARRFLTRWLISPDSNSFDSSACFRPVVQEDAEHDPSDYARIVAFSRGDPPDLLSNHDAEIDLLCTYDRARSRERGPDAVAVGRGDV